MSIISVSACIKEKATVNQIWSWPPSEMKRIWEFQLRPRHCSTSQSGIQGRGASQEHGDSWRYEGSIILIGCTLFFFTPNEKAACLDSVPLNQTLSFKPCFWQSLYMPLKFVSELSVLDLSPPVHKGPRRAAPLALATLGTLAEAGPSSNLSISPGGVGQRPG